MNHSLTYATLVDVAQGLVPFDLLLRHARVLDMATGEIRPADIGIYGEHIASVHPCDTYTKPECAAEIRDMEWAYVAPGFIDTHVHLESSHLAPYRYADVVVPQGTTTVLWDPHELANVLGTDGVHHAVTASRGLALRVMLAAPSCVPSTPGLEMSGADIGELEMHTMLAWPEVLSVAELMDMKGILNHHPRMTGIMTAGHESGKILDGHARGLTGAPLQAYVAAGVRTDHELVSADDAIEKLRAGLTLQIRGSHAYLFPDLAARLLALPHLGSQLTVCTDDVPPDLLLKQGGMIETIRALIRHGLPAMHVLRMATFNAALALGLRQCGLIAPGRVADLVVLGNLSTLPVGDVYCAGKRVAAQGRMLTPHKAPGGMEHLAGGPLPVHRLTENDFRLHTTATSNTVRVRTIKGVRATSWGERTLPVHNGEIQVPEGLTLMAVKHRHGRHQKPVQLALLEDWGPFTGAIASTYTHDAHNLVIVGSRPQDMAMAGNALIDCGGGMVVVKAGPGDAPGSVLSLLPLPMAGMLADAPPETLAHDFAELRTLSAQVAPWAPPTFTIKNMEGICLACNAGPHLTDMGLTDGTTRTIVPLEVEA